jgi:putative adenylate-forming enzyme
MNMSIMLKLLHNPEQLRKHERWTRSQLAAYQTEALRRQRDYAYAHSPFYQKFHRGLTDRPLHELPILTKSMMMEHYDELVTDRAIHLENVRAHAASNIAGDRFLNHYWISATSGSSGQPGFFLFDESEWAMAMASFTRGHEWSGVRVHLLHRMKMASVASISPWHISSQVGATVNSWWMPSLRLAASQPLPEIVRRLNDWQPEMLVAYVSMGRSLAEEQIAGRLRIHPHVIYTSSEVLTDSTRRRIEEAWGVPPYNQYASTETAEIASECQKGRKLHLYEDMVIVEVVDEDYRPVPRGEYGAKLLVTTLFSRTQPLIRYELNDSVRLSIESCSCGLPFTLVEGIQGRIEDTLHLPGLNGAQVAVPPLVFNRVMDILPISGWQVIQEEDDSLTVLLSGLQNGFTGKTLAETLSRQLADEGVRVPRIQVQRVEEIPKASSGKTSQIKAYRNCSGSPDISAELQVW